ncbi:unnamed protein product [Blepharisma stoltei]|uniref:EF-hand domain-containing protein n=1 Tax=Blepharisma stoltei TaxID=1481888 RepID=A0AAU9IL23_9CILI|nr:unnamed protein product [Blepharisma stoltei]
MAGFLEENQESLKELMTLRDTLGLASKNPRIIVNEIQRKVGHGSLSFEDFSDLLMDLDCATEGTEKMRKRRAIRRLFDLIDQNKNGTLEEDEIINSLVVLCGGTPDEKIEAVFMLYDTNGDGLISFDELLAHQTAAFRMLFSCHPELEAQYGETPEFMARITVEQIFLEIDTNKDGVITLPEMKAWFNGQEITEKIQEDKSLKIEALKQRKDQLLHRLNQIKAQLKSQARIDSIHNQKKITGLGRIHVRDALRTFREQNSSGFFSRQDFSTILNSLITKYAGDASIDKTALHLLISDLFSQFDDDGNGVVSMGELFCGLSVLCAGSLGSKLQAAVECFDQSGDGDLQFPEIVKFMKSVFRVLIPEDVTEIKPSAIATATAKNLFRSEGVDIETGGVSYEVIKKWVNEMKIN